jgi:MAE_28990/MAE_18760-like HEPN
VKTLQSEFEERLSEVDTYFELLASIEEATRQVGSPRFVGAMDPISAAQQRILYSCVFLQLYNLVESTVTSCFGALAEALRTSGRWRPRDLSEPLQREWVRFTARTHENDLAPDNRLESALHLFSQLVEESPIDRFEVERGGGGSWDDSKIERLGKRGDVPLTVEIRRRLVT